METAFHFFFYPNPLMKDIEIQFLCKYLFIDKNELHIG